jgi:hypothetical protein
MARLWVRACAAERFYRDAIAHLERTRFRVDLARAHLAYGEWLRRERRRIDAREHLRTAHGMFDASGMTAFAERAARELHAAGGTTRKRAIPARHEELTIQEAQIARMARDGLSNPEIATRLSSAHARFSTTYAKSSPSSASPRAVSSTASCPSAPAPDREVRVTVQLARHTELADLTEEDQ